MSRRYFADSGCIKRETMPIGYLKEIWIRGVASADQIHFDAKECFKISLQPEKTIREFFGVARIELVEKVDITFDRIERSTRRGAKKLELLDAILAAQLGDLRSVLFDHRQHDVIISFHFAASFQ